MNNNPEPNNQEFPLPDAKTMNADQWREYCVQLLSEIQRLRGESADLHEQCRAFAQMIPIPDDIKALAQMPMEELLAIAQFQPSLDEILQKAQQSNRLALTDSLEIQLPLWCQGREMMRLLSARERSNSVNWARNAQQNLDNKP